MWTSYAREPKAVRVTEYVANKEKSGRFFSGLFYNASQLNSGDEDKGKG
jgi:hypothetical protein